MAEFNYNQYQDVIQRSGSNNAGSSGTRIGFFKLKNDGDSALVRLDVGNTEDLSFATVHTVKVQQNQQTRWYRISCLNGFGEHDESTCPLCASLDPSVSKASSKVYIRLLVAYADPTTGSYAPAVPVIWERPAGFSRELANFIRDYGVLRNHVFKVTRNGVAGDMKTTYSLSYIPTLDRPDLVPADFSAFNGFDLSKHSFWKLTSAEIENLLVTGNLPINNDKPAATNPLGVNNVDPASLYAAQPSTITPTSQVNSQMSINPPFNSGYASQVPTVQTVPTPPATVNPQTSQAQPTPAAERPDRNFGNKFKF